MSKLKHTPGPWAVDLERHFVLGGDYVPVEAVTKDGNMVRREICTCMLDTDNHPRGKQWIEDCANARLIAAAPDILNALILALEVVEGCDPDTVTLYAPAIRAAIHKATAKPKSK